jgi:site-specific DNA recombinase
MGPRQDRGLQAQGAVGRWADPARYATVNKKLVVVPEEADTVRTMFRLYLECGSVGTLAEELARRGGMAKVRSLTSGRTKGGGPYSVGALAVGLGLVCR